MATFLLERYLVLFLTPEITDAVHTTKSNLKAKKKGQKVGKKNNWIKFVLDPYLCYIILDPIMKINLFQFRLNLYADTISSIIILFILV